MKIALLGYGRMGKAIEKIAQERNHEIVLKIDIDNTDELTPENLRKAQVAIDFSVPDSAYSNIMLCFEANVPVVSGTTGWLDRYDDVTSYCRKNGKSLFYASNYSIGVNIFFEINRQLAGIMNQFPEYDVSLEETHHMHKLDAPSGTAISIAEDVLKNIERKTQWELDTSETKDKLRISAIREGEIPGIHTVTYDSEIDCIEIKHSAKSRKGFAMGAVLAAEYIHAKKGVFSMKDLMND